MVDTNRARAKDVVGHVLGSRTFTRQLPKELLELQDYLRLLTECVERFKSVGERVQRGSFSGAEVSGLGRSGRWESKPSAGFSKGSVRWISSIGEGREGIHRRSRASPGAVSQGQHRAPPFVSKKSGGKVAKPARKQSEATAKEPASRVEMSFAVREEQQEPSQVGVIELEPPEEAIVLDDLGRKDLEEDNDSEIGVYFIDEVNRARLIDVVQRELRTLVELCPAAKSNVSEISGEFYHFEGCRRCLNKVSAVLPDLLKEIQELIKYIKKKRNEPYKWPDDSEYLRKNSESAGPPESGTTRVRQEAVGYVTVEMPRLSRAAQATAQNLKRCSVKMANHPLVSMRQTEAQSELRVLQKLEMLDLPADYGRNIEYPIEYSSLQMLLFLKADPVCETLHFLPGESKRFLEVLDEGEKKRDFSIDLSDLKGFMLDVQKSQLELQETLLGESEAVLARDPPKAGPDDSCEIDTLHTVNNARTAVIKTLLKGLGNAWSMHRLQEVASLLQQLQDLYSSSMKDFQWGSFPLPETGTEFQVQEIPSEGEISKTIYSLGKEVRRERTRVCFSEIMGKNSKCEQSRSEIGSESLLKCEKIVDGSTISGQSPWRTPTRSKEKMDPVGATINVTVTIGEEEGSRYQSAISMLPSGATLKGEKSEALFLMNGDDMQVPSVRPLQKCTSEVHIPLPGEDGKAMCRAVKTVKKGQTSTLTFKFKLPLLIGERARNVSRDEPCRSKAALHLREGNSIGGALGVRPASGSLQKLRSRIRDAEDQMEILKSCADRADLVADKLLSDAYERIDNFRDVSDRCDLLFECLNR